MGWAWIGTSDVVQAEEAVVSGNQRVADAKQGLAGWIYFQNFRSCKPAFAESVNARTALDFGIRNEMDSVHPTSTNLYDVCT